MIKIPDDLANRRYKIVVIENGEERNITEAEEEAFRKMALKDVVICMAFTKLTSLLCYVLLFTLVFFTSSGKASTYLQVLIILLLPLQLIHAACLLYGALQEKVWALTFSLLVGIAAGILTSVLGVFGAVFYIRMAKKVFHYFIAVVFVCLCCSICTLCTDLALILSFKHILLYESVPLESNRRDQLPSYVQTAATFPVIREPESR